MVAAARDLDLEAEPEEGRAAELASMRDALDKLHQRLDQAREDALQTAEAAARSQDRLADMLNAETGFIDLRAKKSLEHDIARAQREAEKSRRRALKLEAKLEQTQKEAGQAGLVAPADEAQK
jgi:DNA uptake protein ComE-like DNA-binding protein